MHKYKKIISICIISIMDIEIEYQQWILSQNIVKLLLSKCEGNNTKKCKYEAYNIIERWFLWLLNKNVKHEWSTIYHHTVIDDDLNQKMISEIVEKKILSKNDAIEFTKNVLNMVDRFLKNKPTSSAEVHGKSYKSFSIEIADDTYKRLKSVEGITDRDILKMRMRYRTVIERGQTWSMPRVVYDTWYKNHGVTIEGFASPINSKMLGKKGAHFCSLFYDTDEPFGSIGSFFKLDDKYLSGAIAANPPFVPSLMDMTIESINRYILRAKELGNKLTIYSVVPLWEDAGWFQEMIKSDNLIFIYILQPRKYYFDYKEKDIVANFKSVIMVFSTHNIRSDKFYDVIDAFLIKDKN